MVLDTIWNTGYLTLQAASAGPQTVSWINPSGGLWIEGTNWDTGTPPSAVDNAVIDLDGTYTVAVDTDITVGAFSVGGTTGTQTLSLNGFTLTADGTSVVSANGVLDIGAGILTGAGDLTNSGTVDLGGSGGGGNIEVPLHNPGYLYASASDNVVNGALTTEPSSIIRVSGATNANASLTIANGFTNAGLIDISQGTSYSGYTNTLTVTTGTIVNTGTIQSTVGSRNGTRVLNASVDNQGTIDVASHDLFYTGGSTLTTDAGTITIPDGRILTLENSTTLVLGTNTTLTPTTTGRINVNGNITLASDFTLASGEPALNLDINNDNVTTISGSGSFTNADTVLLRADIIDVPFTNQGFLSANDDAIGSAFNGAFDNPASGVFRLYVEDNSGVTIANGFTNAGLINISQGSSYTGYVSTLTVTTGTLTNAGTIQSTVGARLGSRVLNAEVDNQGVIALTDHDLVIPSPRTITTDAGTLTIPDGRTLTFNSGTTAILGTNTTLTPTATGRLNMNGNITLASDFTLASGEPALNLDNNNSNVTTISGSFSFTNADSVYLREDVVDVTFTNQGFVSANEVGAGSAFNGAFDNPAVGVLRIYVEGNTGVTIANGFTNAGVINISQGSSYTGYTSTLTVTTGTLTNTGTIQATAGARGGTRVLNAEVDNQNIIHLVDHGLVIPAPRTLTTDAGTLTIADGQTLTLNTGTTAVLGTSTTLTPTTTGRIIVHGNLSLASDFTLASGEPAFNLDNNNSNVTTVSGPGSFTNADSVFLREDVIDVDVVFTNQGFVSANEVGAGTAFNGTFDNPAAGVFRIYVEGNTGVTIANGFTNAGTINISQGSSYTGYTSTLTVTTGTLTNTGTIQATAGARGGTRVLNAEVDNQNIIHLVDHGLVIPAPRTLTTDAGTVTVADGQTLTLNSGSTTILGTTTTLTPTATGRIVVHGNLTLASNFTLASGEPAFNLDNNNDNVTTISSPGSFTSADTVLLRADVIDAAFTNQGFLSANDNTIGSELNGAFDNSATGVFRLYVEDNTTVTVANGFTNAGTIDISQGSTYTSYTITLAVATGTLTNTGTIQSTAGARGGTRALEADVDNQGTIDVSSNSLRVTSTTTFTNAGTSSVASGLTLYAIGGTFTNTLTGTLEGAGTIDAAATTFVNLGTTSPGTAGTPAGILTFDDILTLDVQSNINIDLNGLTLGTEYDQVVVTGGPLVLNGALNVTLSGFTPVEGNSFTVLTFPSRTGDFTSMTGLDLGGGLVLDPIWTATSLGFTVISVPAGIDFTWEGGTSTDWNVPTNWNPNGLPDIPNSVWIRQAPANQPVVSSSALVGSVVVQPEASITVDVGQTLSVYGDLDAGTSIVGGGTVLLEGSGTTVVGTVSNLDVQGTVTLGGTVSVTSNAVVGGTGRLTMGGGTMTVAGAFSTTGSGALIMNNAADVLNVNDVTFSGDPSSPSAGILNVTGNFVQGPSGSSTAFAATGTHLTVFNGAGAQSAVFNNPGAAASRFQELQVTNSAQVNFGFCGSAEILGSILVDGSGSVNLAGADATVGGDFSTAESGTLSMSSDECTPNLNIAGNATFAGGGTGTLTSGTLMVGGNFTQSGAATSFVATGSHSTALTSDGPTAGTVSFANPDSLTGSHFNQLTIQSETSGGAGFVRTLNTPVIVLGNATLDPQGPDVPAQLTGSGELIVNGSIGFGSGSSNISPAAIRVGGALNLTANVAYGVGVTEFFGTGAQTIPMRDDYFAVIVSGDSVNFDGVGTATIGGDLFITGTGLLDVDSATVTVLGSLFTQDQGRLRMDVTGFGGMDVAYNASFAGGSTSGTLTDGTLNVGGDFTQTTGFSAQSFAPGPNHVTVFDGTAAQTVIFESPTLNESRFGDLRIDNTSAGGFVLNTPVLVRDDFLTPAAPANPATVFGNGNTITTYSIDIDNVIFDNAPLDVLYDSDYATYSEANNITLVNMDPAIMQIQIDRGSGTFDLGGITFSSPFTTGGYVHLDGAFWTIIWQSVSSPEPGGAVTTVNGATYCWDAGCA